VRKSREKRDMSLWRDSLNIGSWIHESTLTSILNPIRHKFRLKTVRIWDFPVFVECCMPRLASLYELDRNTSDSCPAMLWPPLRVRSLYGTQYFNKSLESFLLFDDCFVNMSDGFPKQRVEKTIAITDRMLSCCDLGLETCKKILHSLAFRGLNHLRLDPPSL